MISAMPAPAPTSGHGEPPPSGGSPGSAPPAAVSAVLVPSGVGDVLVALELVGQAGRFPGLLSWSTEGFEVRSGGPVAVGLDGEAIVLDPPLRFTSLPGALQVRLPESAGLAPAARAVPLTSASFGELFRVAAGR